MGTTLGKYELIRKLAVGGMAEVHLAQTLGPMGFAKTLVVKRILPFLAENQDFVTMFLNEARLAALLNHANVVQIFDLGEEAGTFYLAMELVDGPNLRDLNKGAMASGERLPISVALKIVSLACEGLAYAHEFVDPAGVPLRLVHRDISPHNILLSRSGNVKVSDFGIAKAASIPSITKTGKIKGKLKYMSPEQLRDQPLDRRSDVWAMGITLYEVLAGARPFEALNEAAIIVSIINQPPTPLAEHEVESAELLQPIIDRALAKDREQRYPDARAFQNDLEHALIQLRAVVRGHEIAQAIARFCPVDAPRLPSLGEVPAAGADLGLTVTPTEPPLGNTPVEPERSAHRDRTDVTPPEALSGPVASDGGSDPTTPLPVPAPPQPAAAPKPALDDTRVQAVSLPPELPSARAIARAETAPLPIGPPPSASAEPVFPARPTDPNAIAAPVFPARSTDVNPIKPTRPPSAWAWVQRHPVIVGLLVGMTLVALLLMAMLTQLRELGQRAAEEARLSAPLVHRAAPPPPVATTPVMDVTARPAIAEVPDERKDRAPIDEPGAAVIAKEQAAQAVAAGKPAPPVPHRAGPLFIQYGILELKVVPPCQVEIDRTPYGVTPLTIPLEPGSHTVTADCAQPLYRERFPIFVSPGGHLTYAANIRQLRQGERIASSLLTAPVAPEHHAARRRR